MKIRLLGVAGGLAATLVVLSAVTGATAQTGRTPASVDAASLWSRVWAMPGHDSLRTGRTPVIGPQTPTVRWSAPIPGSTSDDVSDPVVSLSNTVYLLVGRDESRSALIAIAPDGTVRYLTNQDLGVRGQPAIGIDGNVYVWSALGLSAITPFGQVRWSFSGGRSNPTVAPDGRIYVHGEGGGVHVLNPNGTESHFIPTVDGEYLLKFQESMSVGLDGSIYFGTQNGWWAFSATGSRRYHHQGYGSFDTPYELPAIAADGSSYYGPAALAADGTVKALSGLNGGAVLGADGTIYVLGDRGPLVPGCPGKTGIVAHNPNGTLKWCHSTGSRVGSLAIDGEGTIYYNAIGAVGAVSPDGTRRWELAVPDLHEFGFYSARTLALGPDGALYVRSRDRFVVVD